MRLDFLGVTIVTSRLAFSLILGSDFSKQGEGKSVGFQKRIYYIYLGVMANRQYLRRDFRQKLKKNISLFNSENFDANALFINRLKYRK